MRQSNQMIGVLFANVLESSQLGMEVAGNVEGGATDIPLLLKEIGFQRGYYP